MKPEDQRTELGAECVRYVKQVGSSPNLRRAGHCFILELVAGCAVKKGRRGGLLSLAGGGEGAAVVGGG